MSVAPEPVNPEHDPMTIDPSNLGSVDPLSVEGLFLVALGKQGDARAAFLAEQCGDDDRRQRVEALLAAYENAGSFLEKPAISIEPTPVGQYLAPCEVPGSIGKLGPYEILEEIGRGGMGVVFRAHDPKLQRIVAVKALAPELARLPSARQRFLREARAAAAISHPHVVTIFAVDGTEEASLGTERATLPYLVMECIVGQTLHDKIKRVGALKTEEIVRISRQIAEGLGAAHKRGLIHRDIKPANILLENGVERVKITDFGLARTVSDGGITHTGEILGTPQCMSPEQARGEMVDQRSDLFSLGCVMYTMCTGVSPFRADNMLAVMKKVCEVTPRPIAELNRDIPEWLGQLVHQLLEKQAELRVQTAGEVVETLEARATTSGPRPVHTSVDPKSATSPHPHPETVPKGAMAPMAPHWIRKWRGDVIEFGMLSLLLGTVNGLVFREPFVTYMEALFLGVMFWVWAVLFQIFIGRLWWIRWSVFGASMAGLAAGGILGTAINQFCQSHPASTAILIGLMGVTGLQLVRWVAHFWNQIHSKTTADPSESSPRQFQTLAQLRSPWSILGWILIALLGVGLLTVAFIIPAYLASQAKPIESAVVYLPDHPEIVSVFVDGQPIERLHLDADGHRWFETVTGPHNLYIGFESDPGEEKFFHNTVTLFRGNNTIDAKPTTRPRNPGTPQPTLQDRPVSMPPPAGPSPDPKFTLAVASTPSLPLADAVEVLADPAQMPAPATGMVYSQGIEMTQAVWIDEPGLLIRMKRLGFEGHESTDLEYYSRVAWGTGAFMATNSLGEHAHHFPAGRYQVLVQDLDYGWALDRRGTITIGNGPLYVHVKRSFDAHQLHSDGDTQFPVPFRWAGKTYQIHNHEEIAAVNGLLAATNSVNPVSFATPNSLRQHPLFQEAVETDSPGGHSLKRERTLAQIDIQSADMQAGFMSPLGRLEWKGPHKSSGGVFVPRQELRMFVKDELMGWSTPGWYDNLPIATDDPLTAPLVVRRDRARIKKFSETGPEESPAFNVRFHWFGTSTHLYRRTAPAVCRLIAAWADGQPDVPEAELLRLGDATLMKELWRAPSSEFPAPLATDAPKPEFVPPAFLVPGSTPGTWRIKEPPEGAVVNGDSSTTVSSSPSEFLLTHRNSSEKIPLGEAVEILTDPSLLPLRETSGGNFQSLSEPSWLHRVNVWIDEPGLHVSLKRLDFEGQGKSGPEFYSSNYWGVGEFRSVEEPGVALGFLGPGDYSLVVRDVAYGWNLERQGTITLGAGPTTIHVKRRFEGQQVKTQWPFPIPFRWAGKTYQIRNVNQRLAINDLLRLLEGSGNVRITKVSETYNIIHSISEGRFVAEAVLTDPADDSLSLRRDVTRASIEILSPGMIAGLFAYEKDVPGHVRTGLGEVVFRGPQTSVSMPVPPENAEFFIRDELLGWGIYGPIQGSQTLDAAALAAGPFKARRDRAWIKKFAEMPLPDISQPLTLKWFDDSKSLAVSSLPAARRLIAAYADGTPDVPETELLKLGMVETFDELWTVPDVLPEETTKAIVLPGNTPGTWRIKEPPAGAVVKD